MIHDDSDDSCMHFGLPFHVWPLHAFGCGVLCCLEWKHNGCVDG